MFVNDLKCVFLFLQNPAWKVSIFLMEEIDLQRIIIIVAMSIAYILFLIVQRISLEEIKFHLLLLYYSSEELSIIQKIGSVVTIVLLLGLMIVFINSQLIMQMILYEPYSSVMKVNHTVIRLLRMFSLEV